MQRATPFFCHPENVFMRTWLPLLVISAIFFSCKKDTKSLSDEGVVTGISVSTCASIAACPNVCDGSLYFHFTDRADTKNVVIDNPTIFKFPQNANFPVRVSLDYISTTRCGITAIKVTWYKIL